MASMEILGTLNRNQSPSKEKYVTLLWPNAPSLAVIAGQWWRRPNGKIQAWYRDQAELKLCVDLMQALREEDKAAAWRWTDYNGRGE